MAEWNWHFLSCSVFGSGMWALSCGVWGLVPCPGTGPWSLVLGAGLAFESLDYQGSPYPVTVLIEFFVIEINIFKDNLYFFFWTPWTSILLLWLVESCANTILFWLLRFYSVLKAEQSSLTALNLKSFILILIFLYINCRIILFISRKKCAFILLV